MDLDEMFSISKTGSMRSPVVVVGPLAFKFAKNQRGRASNLYEADLYLKSNDTRRAVCVRPYGSHQRVRS